MNQTRPKIITVVNQKGGVGKTTVTCNLAFAAVDAGLDVLVMDFDTQGNTSQILMRDPQVHKRRGGVEQYWDDRREPLDVAPSETPYGAHLKLVHGHQHLDVIDKKDDVMEKAVALREQIRRLPYDRIIIDTPPSIGPRQIAPMLWSDVLLVPVEPTQLAMSGLPALIDTVVSVKRVNRGLQVLYVVNRFKHASNEQKRMLAALREKFGAAIIAELPDRVAVADSLAEGRPAWRRGKSENKAIWREFAKQAMAA
jgi:chromosome partitioning protein